MRAPCKVTECREISDAKGYCPAHYRRWSRHGNPLAGRLSPGTSLAERLAARSERVESGCIEWRGMTDRQGYGHLRVDGRMMLAHRAAWLAEFGTEPDGKELDHGCHNPPCINTAHLRPSTKSENQQNRTGANANSSTGVRGVRQTASGRYSASFRLDGTHHWVGTFDTIREADAALRAAREVSND